MFKMSELLFFLAVGYFLFNRSPGSGLGGLFGTLGTSVKEFKKALHGGDDRPTRDLN